MLLHVSVQIENNRFRIDKSASSNQLLFLTTALCNATLALNKWEGLTLMLYYLSMGPNLIFTCTTNYCIGVWQLYFRFNFARINILRGAVQVS